MNRKPRGYWTKERCLDEAIKYKYRVDFRQRSHKAYDAAKKKGWLDSICKHMSPKGNKYNRIVYVYEFTDNHAYVGLTYDMKTRIRIRENNQNDSVTKHINKTGLNPELKILSELIPVEKAIIYENIYYHKYKCDGWNMLNRVKTRSIGSSMKWTKDKCLKQIKKCGSRTEFYRKAGLVQAIKRNGWLDEMLAHIPLKRISNGYYTKEKCIELLRNCKSSDEMKKTNHSAYVIACKKNWLIDIQNIIK